MRNYFYILLFFTGLSFGQTEFTAIKLKSNPVTLNDTTQVDLLVREKTGSNKGLVRKVTWPYLGSLFSNYSIPVTGTVEDNPITGDLKFVGFRKLFNGTLNKYSSLYLSDTSLALEALNQTESLVYSSLYLLPEGIYQTVYSNLGNSSVLISNGAVQFSGANDTYSGSINVQSDGVRINSNDPTSQGLLSETDFTSNITDLAYTQKKYVDEADNARIDPIPVDGSLTTSVSSNWIYDYVAAISSDMAGKVGTLGDETIAGTKTYTTSPIFPTPSTNDNSTKGATTAYVDAADATKITNGGNTTGATVNIGSNDAQSVVLEYNNTPVLTVVSTSGVSLPNGASITNASSSGRGSILMGTTGAGITIQRNLADAIPSFIAANIHTSSTGNIASFNSNISGTTATRAYVAKDGTFVAPKYTLSALNTAPSSSTDTGTTGEIRVTSNYIYVCTATNTWVRSALTTW